MGGKRIGQNLSGSGEGQKSGYCEHGNDPSASLQSVELLAERLLASQEGLFFTYFVTKFIELVKKLKERDYLRELNTGGRILLKLVSGMV
jgi:hypothetical protein